MDKWVILFSLTHLLLSLLCQTQFLPLAPEEVKAYNIMISTLKIPDQNKAYNLCDAQGPVKGVIITCKGFSEANISHVVRICISGLDLSSGVLPDALVNFTQLETLDLSGNQIQGTIPESLGKLSKLKILDLTGNNLQGHIPDSIGNLSSLQFLYLGGNKLNGTIPNTLGNLMNLYGLELYQNFLSGEIPRFFTTNLKALRFMRIQVNNFSGNLPMFFTDKKILSHIDCSNNKFTGSLTWSIGTMKQLRYLNLASNNLTGEIPEIYSQLKNIWQFSVAGNSLSGPIPSFIGDWTELSRLELMGNYFTGPLPPEIFNLYGLNILWVSDLIADTSPTYLPNYANFSSRISSLILRNCSISGTIPEYIGNMRSLVHLDLSLNRFTGELPDSLQNIYTVKMSFAGNQLGGKFPYWVSNNTRSVVLDLSDNYFYLDSIVEPRNIRHDMNFFGCCQNNYQNSTFSPFVSDPQKIMEKYCPPTQPMDDTLFINCGGSGRMEKYEADNATWKVFVSQDGRWGYSCAGNFIDDTFSAFANSSGFIRSTKCAVSPLYETARHCPVSLTYYAFCMRRGTYNVQLHFSEIVFGEEQDYSILKERVFDIYIQNMSRVRDFNIKSKAGGPNQPWTESFVVSVEDDSLLKIQLLWAGKGDVHDKPLLNGPLISAITVKPGNINIYMIQCCKT